MLGLDRSGCVRLGEVISGYARLEQHM